MKTTRISSVVRCVWSGGCLAVVAGAVCLNASAPALAAPYPMTASLHWNASAGDPWTGTFKGGQIRLEIQGGPDSFNGTIDVGKARYTLTAALTGETMLGKFTGDAGTFDFTATLGAGSIVLSTGGTSHTLAREGAAPGNPLSDPGLSTPTPPDPGVPGGAKRYRHAKGFAFNYPSTCTISELPDELTLRLPAEVGDVQASVAYTAAGDLMNTLAKEFVRSAQESLFKQFPNLRPVGNPEPIVTSGGVGALMRFETAEGRMPAEARYVYSTVLGKNLVFLILRGSKDAVRASEQTARTIFASFEMQGAGPALGGLSPGIVSSIQDQGAPNATGNAPAPAASPAPTTAEAPVPSDLPRSFRVSTGLRFSYPDGWQAQQAEDAVSLTPAGEAAKAAFILAYEDSEEAKSPSDPEVGAYVQTLVTDQFPFLSRKGAAESVPTSGGAGALYRFTGRSERGDAAASAFVTIQGGKGYLFLVVALSDSIGAAESVGRRIFSTFTTREAAAAPIPTPTDSPAPALGGGKTRYEHPLGVSMDYPSEWKLLEKGGEMALIAPGGTQGDEVYTMSVVPAPEIADASDPRVIQFLDSTVAQNSPALRRSGEAKALAAGTTKGILVSYENPSVPNARIDVYVTVQNGLGISLTAAGFKSRLDASKTQALAAFASFRYSQPSRDTTLAGQWRLTKHSFVRSGGSTHEENFLFRPDGSCQHSSQGFVSGAGMVLDTGPTVTNGRWTANRGRLVVQYEDGSSDTFTYRIQGNVLEASNGGKDSTVWERVR